MYSRKQVTIRFDFDSVKNIGSENNEKMRKIVKIIHIRTCRPCLNRQGRYDLSPGYTQLLQGGVKGGGGRATMQRWAQLS